MASPGFNLSIAALSILSWSVESRWYFRGEIRTRLRINLVGVWEAIKPSYGVSRLVWTVVGDRLTRCPCPCKHFRCSREGACG